MRTKELIYELMIFKNGATFSRYDILNAMQQYAEEYHLSELLKLNKSDVTKSVCGDCLYYLICNHESRDKQICDNYDNEP